MPTLRHRKKEVAHLQSSCLLDLLDMRVQRNPEAVAITSPGRPSLTYHKLFAHLTDMKAVLQAKGVGPQDRVALVLPNGPEMAVAFLTVASTATAAPLNPAYRANEFEFYLEDLKAKALVIHADMESPARGVAQAQRIPVIELYSTLEAEAGLFTLSEETPLPAASVRVTQPNDIALVLHTSGTTSRPKLVPLSHANLLASAAHIVASLNLTDQDRCLNIMPLFHIHGLVGALLASIGSGGSVVCTPGLQTSKFFNWLEAFSPTWYTAVPTMHQSLIAQANSHPNRMSRSSLRFIRSSSAALPLPVMQDLERIFQCPVIEAYGMTEAAHQMATNPLPPAIRKPGSVGRAAGPEVSIVDEQGKRLPTGQTGEVAIRGRNVMGGYEHHQAANDSAFTDGWFRTGDEGYLDEEGYLYLTGRLKEIINRGGEKVAPREIDEQLLAHPAVAQAVTFALPHSTLGEDIAAAVVLERETTITPEELQKFLRDRLADFKIPQKIVILTEIPKGPTGKIQRIGLADKLADQLKPADHSPTGTIETIIAGVFEMILGMDQVGVSDNFFALGGDSLRATQVASRLNSLLQLDVNTVTVFENPSISGLSQKICGLMDPTKISALSELLENINDNSSPESEEIRT
jgi:acyl-CoA synthetase (AMP-forming)/AMP-acid ligase II